ncbi:hypothetical protein B0I35DRAFT_447617 [Stachybotrys elegans]|uniref:HNH nuclease domain-containing protein n=1 Tax=Stachybotrys elegans TaxID=80388 RepID=A0A8K0SEZ2_9HYPO|nr:hypothetical protein B0I35DRAFT_447617 [Stachybotrys elegans]
MGPLQLKPRRVPFCTNSSNNVTLLHPGYPDGQNILFFLPMLDSGGIHHETVWVACALLANSRWDGFLSVTRDGEEIPEPKQDTLQGERYYFRVPGDPQWAVIPSIKNLRCPSTVPGLWASCPIEPATTDDVGKRDQTCRITTSLIPNEIAHIIPQAQIEWWQSNSMFTYTANPDFSSDTRCAENAILLRRDLHKMWDDHRFAIVPKRDKWVVHVLWKSPSKELETEYHNLELQPLYGVARQFLLCRFALAILSKSMFLKQGTERKLVTLDAEGEVQVRSMSPNEYSRRFFPTGRANSRSGSPTKRQRPDRDMNGTDVDKTEMGRMDGMESSTESEEQRGRPRKRRGSFDTPSFDPLSEPPFKHICLAHTPPRSISPAY